MYNYSEIITQAATLMQWQQDADYKSKMKPWVNMAYDYMQGSYDYWSALQSKYTFSTVNGTEKYFLPSDFDKPFRLFDTTNNKKLTWITRENYYDGNISTISSAQTGVPNYAMLYGESAVAYENTSSFTVQVKSSSSSDNGGIVCYVEGWLDSAKTILGGENITISTGTPTTYVAGVNTYYGITKFVKSADTTGYLTLADTTPHILATIAPNDRRANYTTLYLGLIPAGTYVNELLYKRKVKQLVNDEDYPFVDCGNFLVLYSYGLALSQQKESETRAQQIMLQADKVLSVLLRNEMAKMGSDYQNKMIPATAQAHRQ